MPESHFTKQDWSLFRSKIAGWQEAYMARLIDDYISLLKTDSNPSDRFWELEKRIRHDKKKPGVTIEMRRSTMIENIISLLHDEVISFSDLDEFSNELKDIIKYFMNCD